MPPTGWYVDIRFHHANKQKPWTTLVLLDISLEFCYCFHLNQQRPWYFIFCRDWKPMEMVAQPGPRDGFVSPLSTQTQLKQCRDNPFPKFTHLPAGRGGRTGTNTGPCQTPPFGGRTVAPPQACYPRGDVGECLCERRDPPCCPEASLISQIRHFSK